MTLGSTNLITVKTARFEQTALGAHSLHVAQVGTAIVCRQTVETHTLTRTLKSGGCCTFGYFARLQVGYPLVQRCLGHFVEIVNTQHIIFGEEVASLFALEPFTLVLAKEGLALTHRKF